ncbi:hypothetical protein [Vibrio neptunius]|uniref:Lipase helper protein n=1 Tax=Vibrio neptunius TaxID=170651 RepID=A0ABS2ZYQ4_9VIBR|nr:hypothetical protein [Vibrio neptunius]MBN3492684.1 hypothetical protein [Vibrio neptunius]MBN3515181.1 hypothetical protein [Vibrio neptunius]MBN3548943.1 hypothetical protein [Vibrio neptunius]MBN3577405.1 hypothetical protein [Vibrio neptunius]MCH9871069.1 hypothetical protein [Vibrio neptunius]
MSKWVWASAVCAIAGVGAWFAPIGINTVPVVISAYNNKDNTEAQFSGQTKIQEEQEAANITDRLAIQLQKELGDRVNRIEIQVGLRDFRDYLTETYPDQSPFLFNEVIKQAFPEYADIIFEKIALMEDYEQWLLSEMKPLLTMTFEEKQIAVWAKRRELFGDDADIIWSAELAEREQRIADTQKSIELLNSAYDMEINQRLFSLKATIETNFVEHAGGKILSPAMMASTFFSLDSVQRDLSNMSSYQRAEQLASIRRDLGYSESQIEKAAKQDRDNELRWQIGYQYMGERQALLASLSGEELDSQLAQLRIDYFGEQASTLEKEEQQGFYRFERPRVYGRN